MHIRIRRLAKNASSVPLLEGERWSSIKDTLTGKAGVKLRDEEAAIKRYLGEGGETLLGKARRWS